MTKQSSADFLLRFKSVIPFTLEKAGLGGGEGEGIGIAG
jgi:hypothetical protein